MTEKSWSISDQLKDVAVDVRNEVIVQTANLYLLARKILLASLGTVALTAEEASVFVDKLVERGELAEADVRKLLSEVRAEGQETRADVSRSGQDAVRKASATLEESIESILMRLNVPTRGDVEDLSRKISALSEKVVQLSEQEAKSSVEQ